MEAGLIYPQQKVYFQLKKTLHQENSYFSKADLKCFVHWLYEHFPYDSWDLFLNDDFLEKVGESYRLGSINQ